MTIVDPMGQGHSHAGSIEGTSSVVQRAVRLSLLVGILLLLLKTGAYWLTGSSAILGDAAESILHVFAVGFVAWSARLAEKPADRQHPYGHAKISFFSAGIEGAMIFLTGWFVIYDAVERWIHGVEIQHLEGGALLTAIAMVINAVLGLWLLWLGKRENNRILRANAHHVLADVWTSVGAVAALLLVWKTGWPWFDPLIAILISLNIIVTGFKLMRESAGGLMDWADPKIRKQVEALLERECPKRSIDYHLLRHRDLGDAQWVDLHLLFDDHVSVRAAHADATAIENAIRDLLGADTEVTTHLEPRQAHAQAHRQHPRVSKAKDHEQESEAET